MVEVQFDGIVTRPFYTVGCTDGSYVEHAFNCANSCSRKDCSHILNFVMLYQ